MEYVVLTINDKEIKNALFFENAISLGFVNDMTKSLLGSEIVTGIFKIINKYKNINIIWSIVEGVENKIVKNVDSINGKQTELLFFYPDFYGRSLTLLGYAFFSSPALINYRNNKIRYPTWEASCFLGVFHSSIVNVDLLNFHFKNKISFQDFIIILSYDLTKSGGTSYFEPLLFNNIEHNLSLQNKKIKNQSIKSDLFFLKHRATFGQKFLYFINVIFYNFSQTFLLFRLLQVDRIKLKKLTIEECINKEISNLSNADSYDVVIPTIGRAEYIENVLLDLNNQTHKPNNVIIVEQIVASKDGFLNTELDFLNNYQFDFRIKHEIISKLGVCNARNIAMQMVESDFVFLADDDIRFENNILEDALVFMKKNDINAATLGVYRKGESIKSKTAQICDTFGSGCSIVKTSILRNLKFDIRMEFGFGEDIDFGIAIRKSGHSIYYLPQFKIVHLKAPIGGFRYYHEFPWSNSSVIPKPSPTIIYNYIKNFSTVQIKGYKTFYFLNRLKKSLFSFKLIVKQWNLSIYWAAILAKSKV